MNVRIITEGTSVNAETDQVILCDLTGDGGDIDLPAGSDGLTFSFAAVGGIGSGEFPIVPDGEDSLDSLAVASIQFNTYQWRVTLVYKSGLWYQVN